MEKYHVFLVAGLVAFGAISVRAGEDEVVQFASVTIVGPHVDAGSAVDQKRAAELAVFYRDQVLKGLTLSFEKEDAAGFYFTVDGKHSVLVARSGDRVTSLGLESLNYVGSGLWCLRTGR
jgi:hypothetical protein